MPTVSTLHRQGDLIHPELVCGDLDDSYAFYQSLFGWDYRPGVVGPHYIATRDGADCAGLAHTVTRSEEVPNDWLPYVSVDDPDRTCRQIAELGGRVLLAARDLGEFGRIAFVADPFGAIFALWRGGPVAGLHVIGEMGTLCMAELFTPEPDVSRRFYETIFGLELFATGSAGDSLPVYGRADSNELPVLVSPAMALPTGNRARWLVYLGVADLDRFLDEVQGSGGRIIASPAMRDGRRVAFVGDPNGATLGVVETASRR
ncbi:VOC family protein [Nocardia brasiliensis]|uniref:VOC family protein n=1 Tax=Nocardia brasiliensis TaxID=37326 RepID=UPI003D8F993F